MLLSVKDAASILNVPEKTIYRWIKQKSIPSYKINEQIRFNRAELLEWATSNRFPVSADLFKEGDADDLPLPSFPDALHSGGIVYKVGGTDPSSVLRAVVNKMKLRDEVDREFLYQVLLARETLGSTGVGDGIAIPHVRNPVVLHVAKPMVTLCFLEHAVDFKAIDGIPVNVLFTLISPSIRAHLHLLTRLAFILKNPEIKAALKRQAPREELMTLFLSAESDLTQRSSDAADPSK